MKIKTQLEKPNLEAAPDDKAVERGIVKEMWSDDRAIKNENVS